MQIENMSYTKIQILKSLFVINNLYMIMILSLYLTPSL